MPLRRRLAIACASAVALAILLASIVVYHQYARHNHGLWRVALRFGEEWSLGPDEPAESPPPNQPAAAVCLGP